MRGICGRKQQTNCRTSNPCEMEKSPEEQNWLSPCFINEHPDRQFKAYGFSHAFLHGKKKHKVMLVLGVPLSWLMFVLCSSVFPGVMQNCGWSRINMGMRDFYKATTNPYILQLVRAHKTARITSVHFAVSWTQWYTNYFKKSCQCMPRVGTVYTMDIFNLP